MGGELFVGIKKDGIEHLMLRWTNNLPYWFLRMNLPDADKAVKEYIDMVDEPNHSDFISRVKQVQSSEYGIVLIDFDSKQVFSRQGYCSLDSHLISLVSNEEENQLISNLIELNQIIDVKTINYKTHQMESIPIDNFLNWFDSFKTNKELLWQSKEPHNLDHVYPKTQFSIDDNNEHASKNWKEVKNFLKKNGWKSKVWTIKKVKKEYVGL